MTTRHAAVYVRISDDREGAGLGVERQEKDCRQVADRLGWAVVQLYVDNDLTAYAKSKKSKPRPAYERMKADMAAGLISGVIAWHTDRLHRTPRELEDFIDACEEHDVSVETVKAGIVDLRTPAGQAIARTLCAWAFYESAHKSERVRAKYVQLAEAGLVGNGGCRPFGYGPDRLTLVEEEAEQLRWAYGQVLTGRSLRSIAADLTSRGFLTTQGNPWSVQGLRLNLLSPRNVALREHRRVVVGPAVWPPIIDVETWEKVCVLLRDPRRKVDRRDGSTVTSARKHLLTGFLFCGACGGKMVPRSNYNARRRYGCLSTREGGCGGPSAYVDTMDELLTYMVLAKLEQDANLQPDEHDPTEALRAAIAADEARLSALAEAFAADPDGNPLELRVAGARIRKRITDNRQEIARAAVQERLSNPLVVRAAWSDYDLHQRRAVIGTLVERITVGPGTSGRFDPHRVAVVWR